MTINQEVKTLLKEHNINETKGLLMLLAIHYELPFNEEVNRFFHDELVSVNIVKIVERTYPDQQIVWNVPLFLTDVNCTNEWQWVLDEYRPLFRNIDKSRGGTPVSCIKRMKKFFSEHPEVRKDDVIQAAKMYIREISEPKYLQQADYFIFKDNGPKVTSRLEQYLEIIRENKVSTIRNQMM